MITADQQHIWMFLIGNIVAFLVAVLAIKFFIGFISFRNIIDNTTICSVSIDG